MDHLKEYQPETNFTQYPNKDQIPEFSEFVPSESVLTNGEARVLEIVFDLTLSFVLLCLGIFTNTVTIAVFVKQGFKDSVAVSMTTIALWDLIKCFCGAMKRTTGLLSLWSPAKAETWGNISQVVLTYIVTFTCYVTSVLAAYVAIERCLCVKIPLKIKWFVTPRVSFCVCFIISVVVFGWFSVMFGIYDIFWVFHPRFNTTVAMYRYNSFSTNNTVLFEFYNLSGILWPLVCLLVIVICTVIISQTLRKASLFRNKKATTRPGPIALELSNQISKVNDSSITKPCQVISKKPNRDQQVMKMLMIIIIIYIVTLSPREALYVAKYLIPDFYFLKHYHNLFVVVVFVVFFLDFINGTVNLFVFLAMSSAFRKTFLEMFPFFQK